MSLSKDMLCRICLKEGIMKSIFEETPTSTISAKIMSISRVQIYPEDGLPSTICRECLKRLDQCTDFIQLCEESDSKLRIKSSRILAENKIKYSPERENDDSNEYCENLTIITKNEIGKKETHRDVKHRATQKQQCTICGKILSSRFRLQTHLRTHSGERPFPCSHCNKTFALKTSLNLHLRIHTGEKPLQCKECNASFRHPSSLRAHERTHSGETPYQCLLCPKSFHTASHLQYHVRKHTGEKNFECDSCGKTFISRGHLQQHLFLHTGERPHMCFVCGLRLTRASHLRRHMQNLHKSRPSPAEKHVKEAGEKHQEEPEKNAEHEISS